MLAGDLADQVLGAVIHDARGHNVLALAQRADGGGGRGKARPEQARLARAVQPGQQRFGLKHGRVAIARIAQARGKLARVVARECRRRVQRRHHVAAYGIAVVVGLRT
jgi:hypothetical protein